MRQQAAHVCSARSVGARPPGLRRLPLAPRSPIDAPKALPEQLSRLAREWLEQDTDPDTKAELSQLVSGEDVQALSERLEQRLQFG